MGAPHVTIKDAAGRIIEMQASPDFQYDTAFDSFLILKNNGCDNHTLTLVVTLPLEQVVPMTWNLPFLGPVPLPYPDADKTLFVIKPWSATDFASFHKLFLRQCTLWNDKFWLTPPAAFTGLDYKLGGRTVHPNIYCHLFVTVTGTPAGVHRTIQVVNLDKAAAARQLGKRVAALDSADFRSDAGQYDSLDVKNNQLTYADDKGK